MKRDTPSDKGDRPRRQAVVRLTTPDDFDGIIALCLLVYPEIRPWGRDELQSHIDLFPQGQLTAIDPDNGEVVGMAASLIIDWDDYELEDNWRDFTDHGWFTNHDTENGRTLYGAEVMVHPHRQRMGIGSAIYAARRELVERLNLRRIRAGARLRGYGNYADQMNVREYVKRVKRGEIHDPTLCFQMRHGFHVIGVVENYLVHDPESRGHAAVIEWVNQKAVAREEFELAAAKAHEYEDD